MYLGLMVHLNVIYFSKSGPHFWNNVS